MNRKEKLCNIKGNDTGVVLLKPLCLNEMCEVNTSINSRLLSNASKLIGIQEAIGCYLKLKPIADDFFNEFACSIE